MTGLAETALRLRDAAMPGVLGVAGPVGAILTVAILLVQRSLGRPPTPENLAIAFVAVAVGVLMAFGRWQLLSGRRASLTIGVLAIIHALAAAVALRVALGPGTGQGPPVAAAVAAYALALALLMAWCARVPVRDQGTGGGPAGPDRAE